MKRLKHLLGGKNRQRILEALARRKSYYLAKTRKGRDQRIIDAYMNSNRCRKLNIGCGDNVLAGWLNSDILDVTDQKIFLDAREALPFPDESFHFIYSEHLLEHLEHAEGCIHLKECFRTLKPNGVLRISTPDLAFLIRFYEEDTAENREYLKWATSYYWKLSRFYKALVVNHYMKSWGHKFIYDFQLLGETCIWAGFHFVKKETVGESEFSELRNIESHGSIIGDKWNRMESLVIEAEKVPEEDHISLP